MERNIWENFKASKNHITNIKKFLKDFNLWIKADEPNIVPESDLDDINFYKYLLKTAIYFLKQGNINVIVCKIKNLEIKLLIFMALNR